MLSAYFSSLGLVRTKAFLLNDEEEGGAILCGQELKGKSALCKGNAPYDYLTKVELLIRGSSASNALSNSTSKLLSSTNGEGVPSTSYSNNSNETSEPANSRTDVVSNLEGKSDDTATRQDADVSKDKPNVRTGNSSYCLPNRKRLVPFPALQTVCLLAAKLQTILQTNKEKREKLT